MKEVNFNNFPEHDLISSQKESRTMFCRRSFRLWSAQAMVDYAYMQRYLGEAGPKENRIINLYENRQLKVTVAERYAQWNRLQLTEISIRDSVFHDNNPIHFSLTKYT